MAVKDRYAVFGNPIGHSQSPRLHTTFAQQTGQTLSYEAIEVPLTEFERRVREFAAAGGRGANVTVPFKEQAFGLCEELSARAQLAGAVNTLSFREDGSWFGDNTDGVGLVRDLNRAHVHLADKQILVCGAGGAVRGILGPLLEQQPAQLVLCNRTPEKAQQLAQHFQALGSICAVSFAELEESRFDVVINATAAGLSDELPPLPATIFGADATAYDLVYGAPALRFLHWAREKGADRAFDGWGMLLEQAAEAFYLWRGVYPDTDSLRRH